MMDPKDIRLLGDSTLCALRDAVETRLKNWADGWCVDAVHRFAITEIRRVSAADREHNWQVAHRNSNMVFVAITGGGKALAGLLLNGAAPVDSERLICIAMNELVEALDAMCGPAIIQQPDPWLFQMLAGSAIATLAVDDENILLLLAPALVDALAPRSPVISTKALTSRAESLGNAMLTLHVSLELGKLYLQDLHNLQPGDCIPTRVPLDADFSLMLDGARLTECRLGRSDERRAVILESS